MRVLMIVAVALLIAGCSSTTPSVQRYLLQEPELPVMNSELETKIVLGAVQVSSFLAAGGLVYQLEQNQVHQANYHRWAESLQQQLGRQIRMGMQQQLPASTWLPLSGSAHLRSLDYRLDLQIDAFHLTEDGQVRVRGQWQLRDYEQSFIGSDAFDIRQSLAEDGYPAMVSTLSETWHQALQEIARSVEANLIGSKND
ncbi:hypothetical protein CWE09_09120 [Aliidiomarina minuta]|uniref:ABC-type transport auxiliary lipoprotein component domain-containing protein n=1 Tax=Aliidiomarina minuta TaxID=880057 RepID=A0A432W9K3_9GAMM|nr:ABC-type transport auxiliary lipoprotein family protein [Aliidiomarina minuta]RUO26833.1 hypothetical protein CWE09_09120 [Aliidiomarina minuta]